MTSNICPNLVLNYSMFQSEYPPFGYSRPSTVSTSSTFNTLHCHRQPSPLKYTFMNQFLQSNLKTSDDNTLPIVRQSSYGSASISTQTDDNICGIITADHNLSYMDDDYVGTV